MKMLSLSLVSAVILSGCVTTNTASNSRPGAAPIALGPYSPYSTPQKAVTITSRDRGTYVALLPKGTLTVALDSNSSAGYRWKLAQPIDPAVLTVVPPPALKLQPIALPPENLGKPESELWTFKSVGPGTAKVRMIYSRPNRPLDESAIYTFTVNAE